MFAAGACRTRVLNKLCNRYATPKEAEEKLALPRNGQKTTEGENGGADVVSTSPSDVTADTTSLPVPGPSNALQQTSTESENGGTYLVSTPPSDTTADTISLPVPGSSNIIQQSSAQDWRLGSSFYSLPPTVQIEVLSQRLCALALNVAHIEIPPDYLTL